MFEKLFSADCFLKCPTQLNSSLGHSLEEVIGERN
jgi:hypothetical protein